MPKLKLQKTLAELDTGTPRKQPAQADDTTTKPEATHHEEPTPKKAAPTKQATRDVDGWGNFFPFWDDDDGGGNDADRG